MEQNDMLKMNLQYFADPNTDPSNVPDGGKEADPDKPEVQTKDGKDKSAKSSMSDITSKALKDTQDTLAKLKATVESLTKTSEEEKKAKEEAAKPKPKNETEAWQLKVEALEKKVAENEKKEEQRNRDEYAKAYLKSKSLPEDFSVLFANKGADEISEAIDAFGKVYNKSVADGITSKLDTTKPGAGKGKTKSNKVDPLDVLQKKLEAKYNKK